MLREEDCSERRSGTDGYQPKINEVAQNFLAELDKERSRLTDEFPLCALLIEEGMYITSKMEYCYILFIVLNICGCLLKHLTVSIPLDVFLVENSMLMCCNKSL